MELFFPLARKLFFLLMPLLALVVAYLYLDPFMVVHDYAQFYTDPRIVYNRDYNSTEIFIRNYQRYKYDSFIFGNSRSLAFQSCDWKKYLESDRIIHFDASAESLYGIHRKVMFLSKRKVELKNCLFIIDRETLAKTTNSKGHILIKHPSVSGESRCRFQLESLQAFLVPRFLLGYLEYRISGVPPLSNNLFERRAFSYDPASNDVTFSGHDRELMQEIVSKLL